MKEMMMMMMISRSSPENHRIQSISSNDPISTTSTDCPTWKLYENPFYTNTQINHPQKQQHYHLHSQEDKSDHQLKQIHRLQLPISARKIAASFWDLTFIRPFMESEFEMARAKITELKAELEKERKARKKAESTNKKLVRELSEVKKGIEALEQMREEFDRQISSYNAEMSRMQRDMEEERKMLRMAEVLREERVQMKLSEAKLLLEDKLLELEAIRSSTSTTTSAKKIDIAEPEREAKRTQEQEHVIIGIANNRSTTSTTASGEEIKSCVLVEKSASNLSAVTVSQRRASPEPENPHIKRGIKGFVEFPKVVRAIGSKSRHLGTKLECQKAQLMILLKQKTPIRSSNTLIAKITS
ncbi:hypothetical protein ACH5RR_041833 [Cinchona calisaya]|uniref:Protein BRANCHLESS TRICHOME n=1 Tax=Cinchona calisaya TaxID=153742 RepID=A0ABD2XUM6_9GENT